MTHLTDLQLVAAAEGDTVSAAHLAACAACAARVAALRSVIDELRTVEVPEPSPMFWTHLGARINEAIDAPPAVQAGRWPLRSALGWLGALSALLLFTVAIYQQRAVAPAPSDQYTASVPPAVDVDLPLAPDAAGAIHDDEAWAVVLSVAGDLEYDDAHEAGLAPRPGAIERVVTELDDDERAELVRLLTDALKAS